MSYRELNQRFPEVNLLLLLGVLELAGFAALLAFQQFGTDAQGRISGGGLAGLLLFQAAACAAAMAWARAADGWTLQQFRMERPVLPPLALGVMAGAFVSAGMLGYHLLVRGRELQTALNAIWRVKPKPGVSVKAFLVERLVSFGLVVAVGFLLLVSLLVSAALAALNRFLGAAFPALTAIWQATNVLVSLGVVTLLFAMVYKVLPDVQLRWRDVWVGSLVTAGFFSIGKQVIGLYLGTSSVASTYGAAGSVVVLLIWVYYSALVFFFGAEITEAYAHVRAAPNATPSR